MIWPVRRERENDIPDVFTHCRQEPTYQITHAFVSPLLPPEADRGFFLMLHVGKISQMSSFLVDTVVRRRRGVCVCACVRVCVLCVCGSGGRVAAQVSRKWLLTQAWPWREEAIQSAGCTQRRPYHRTNRLDPPLGPDHGRCMDGCSPAWQVKGVICSISVTQKISRDKKKRRKDLRCWLNGLGLFDALHI